MRKLLRIFICLTLGGFGGCMEVKKAAGGAAPAPKPKVADQRQVAPALEMEIRGVNGMMEAHFANNARREVGVLVGNNMLRLKPGQAGKLPVPKHERLRIYDFVDDGNGTQARIWFETTIFPKAAKRRFVTPM